MDVAYDHIQEEVVSTDETTQEQTGPRKDLNTEVREAYTAITASPWGAKLGGFLSSVRKQGESYYEGARQEITAAGTEASKGLTGLVNQTKNLSIRARSASDAPNAEAQAVEGAGDSATSLPASIGKEASALLQQLGGFMKSTTTSNTASTDASNSDIVNETDSFLRRFQSEAAARLKKIQAAEDAADEALERFGLNIKNFLRDAVTVAPPTLNADGTEKSTVLFESKDAEGRRVVHATRFEAQLHVIHTTAASVVQDPQSEEYAPWKESFNVESKTGDIARDLEKYEELRKAMEKLVPEKVDYADFWTRYYFLRHVIETEEQRRRELLQKTKDEEEEVKWDDDEEETEDKLKETATTAGTKPTIVTDIEPAEDESKTPTKATESEDTSPSESSLKPSERRRSNEHSVTDSDASYDILSGATSGGPGTPRGEEEKEVTPKKPSTVAETDEEDDWE